MQRAIVYVIAELIYKLKVHDIGPHRKIDQC